MLFFRSLGIKMIKRDLFEKLLSYTKFPVIAVLGPRQSGKTTLVKEAFPRYKYLSMDNESTLAFALEDPERFLQTYEHEVGIILDEFQYAPKITSYIKRLVDEKKRPGYFVLTGSQNFLANNLITESLAGRVGILNLLPLSISELKTADLLSERADTLMVQGGYPRLYAEHFSPEELYNSYIRSYLEKDVRQLINVTNLSTFQRFLQLCAGNVGQLLNINALATECGVSFATIRNWLSILEASYIIFFLPPYFNNFKKRLIKSPKLYFFDTGIACTLLRISSPDVLALSPFRGALFENMIIADLYKQYCNRGSIPPLYFWRDHSGAHEIDCILDEGIIQVPIEIKSGQTINPLFFKGLEYWQTLTESPENNGYLIYGGSEPQLRSKGHVLGWQDAGFLVDRVKQHILALTKS